jgi:hypothetical protein
MTTEEIRATLIDVQTETAAVLTSGDIAQQRWARTTGVIATALLDLYGDVPAGTAHKQKEDKHVDTAQDQTSDKAKPK